MYCRRLLETSQTKSLKTIWRVRRDERERIEDYEDSDERSSSAINPHITQAFLGGLVKPV